MIQERALASFKMDALRSVCGREDSIDELALDTDRLSAHKAFPYFSMPFALSPP